MNPQVVGQDLESSLLDAALRTTPRAVIVEGAPGAGKSTLVRRFVERCGADAVEVAGLFWESGRSGALVRRLADIDGADPGAWGEAIARGWNARVEPLVVVVDDAHAADAASLQAITSAVVRLRDAPVLVVLVVRAGPDAALPPDVRDVLDRLGAERIGVEPLTPEQTRLLAARVAGVDLPTPVARRLCEHAEGVPRYLVEILRDVPSAHWTDWQTRLPAPSSVQERVHAALAGCSAQARSLVEAAAVLGDAPNLGDAARVAGTADAVAALDEAFGAALLRPAGGHGLDSLRFPGRFVRGAVYASLSPVRRHDLHTRAAELLPDDVDRLRHRVEANPLPDPQLADELIELARRKASEGAWAVVAGALADAARMSATRAEREERLISAVDALAGAGLLGRAIDGLPDIEALPAGTRRDAVLAYVAIQRGRRAEATSYLGTAWRARGVDRDAAAVVCQRQVLHALADWDGDELVRWAGRALEHAQGDAPAAVETRAIVGLGHAARGDLAQAFRTYDDAVRESPGGPQHQRARMGMGWLLLAQDEPEKARAELEFAAGGVGSTGSNRIALWALIWLARTRFVLGDWSGALQNVDRAELLLGATDLELLRPLVHWTAAQIAALRGDRDAAARHLAVGSAADNDYAVMTVPALMARAHVAEAASDYEGVVRHLAPLAARTPRNGLDEPGFWPWHDVYANALVVTDRLAEADAFLRPLEALARRRKHRSATARLAYVRGRLLGARGDMDGADEAFVGARRHLAALPLPYDRARVDYAHGLTLRRAGRRRDAIAVLGTARQGFAALGAQIYVERCDRELKVGRSGARLQDGDLEALTAQERNIAVLVARGLTNREVATEMLLSVKTVQYHLTRTYTKLGIRSRSELAAQFPQAG